MAIVLTRVELANLLKARADGAAVKVNEALLSFSLVEAEQSITRLSSESTRALSEDDAYRRFVGGEDPGEITVEPVPVDPR